VEVAIGDYTSRERSWLQELEDLSWEREGQGTFHSGCILWVQSYLSDHFGFTLKAAIIPILDAVPSIFQKELPQRLLKEGTIVLSSEQVKFLKELNSNLILPIEPIDIVRVIIAGQEYEKGEG